MKKLLFNVRNGSVWLKNVVDRNIINLSKTELDVVQFEYGEIVNSSEISNGIDEIDGLWNQSVMKQFQIKKCTKSNRSFLTYYDRRLMVSRKS